MAAQTIPVDVATISLVVTASGFSCYCSVATAVVMDVVPVGTTMTVAITAAVIG